MARRLPPIETQTPRSVLVARERENAIREHRRRRRLAWSIGTPLVAMALGLPILGNHIAHERAVARAERLDSERARDRLAVALPYHDPEVTRVTGVPLQDKPGRDAVQIRFKLPFSRQAAQVREDNAHSNTVNWLNPPGAVLYPVTTGNQNRPLIAPMTGKSRPGQLPGSLLFPSVINPDAEPKFSEPFQGRNSGAQLAMDGDTGTVTAQLPASDSVGSEVAVYVANEATSEEIGYLNQTQGQQYVTTLRLVDEHGQQRWEVMAQPPQFPSMYGEVHHEAPNGATL